MTLSDKSTYQPLAAVSVRLRPEIIERLDELAAGAGVRRTTLVQEIIEELVPRLESVTPRRGVSLKLRKAEENGR